MKTKHTDGAGLISEERQRQIDVEGWSLQHDDHHSCEMEIAAAQLLVAPTDEAVTTHCWDRNLWGLVDKHEGYRLRQLVIAGALVAAAIDKELRR